MIFFQNTLQKDFATQVLLMPIHLKLARNWVSFLPSWHICFLASPYCNEVSFEAPWVIFQFFLGLLGCKDARKSSLFWIFDKAKKIYNYVASGNQFDEKNIIPGWRQTVISQHWFFSTCALIFWKYCRQKIHILYCNI